MEELDNMIKCHDYGILDAKNIPSEIVLTRRSLGQNAAQSMCLFRNLPFILYIYRNHPKLENVWKCFVELLKICEIVWSYEITELSIKSLESSIKLHLDLFRSTFPENLIPKQHFLLHYARTIRAVGPLRYFNMMRFDAKHLVFKNFRHQTKNFMCLNKTLAFQHQKLMSLPVQRHQDDIKHGVLKQVSNEEILIKLSTILYLRQSF